MFRSPCKSFFPTLGLLSIVVMGLYLGHFLVACLLCIQNTINSCDFHDTLSRWGRDIAKWRCDFWDWKGKWVFYLWRVHILMKGTEWLIVQRLRLEFPGAFVLGNVLPRKVVWGSKWKTSHFSSIILNHIEYGCLLTFQFGTSKSV